MSESLDFKTFLGEDAPGNPTGDPVSKKLYPPQGLMCDYVSVAQAHLKDQADYRWIFFYPCFFDGMQELSRRMQVFVGKQAGQCLP